MPSGDLRDLARRDRVLKFLLVFGSAGFMALFVLLVVQFL